MNIQWHTVIIATFIVSMTVYVVAENSETGGWLYVLILLLAASIFLKTFPYELQRLAGNLPQVQRQPGQPQGPF